MALLETNDTIEEYYKEVKDKYPSIPFTQFSDICKNPFRFFKMKIESPEMPTIFIKYFGKFKVHAATIKGHLKKLKTKKHFGQIGEERYERYTANLNKRLKLIEDNDNLRRTEKDNKKRERAN